MALKTNCRCLKVFFGALATILIGTAQAQQDDGLTLLTIDQVPKGVDYFSFEYDHRSRLVSHRSVILHPTKNQTLLVVDGGYGKWKIDDNTEVMDLNPLTVAFDLSDPGFSALGTNSANPLWQIKKMSPEEAASRHTDFEPVVDKSVLWTDSSQKYIYMLMGHFFNGSDIFNSSYRLTKDEYPDFSIWRLDVTQRPEPKWTKVTDWHSPPGSRKPVRTYTAGGASIPNTDRSVCIGGIIDPYTSKTSQELVFSPTAQMLDFNSETLELNVGEYYANLTGQGYWQGNLDHLPIGCADENGPHPGFLISTMPWSLKLGTTGPDLNATGDEKGDTVPLNTTWLYDLKSGTWYEQATRFPDASQPTPRTRFCTAVMYDQELKTWDLYLHGGQRIDDQEDGVAEVWVLSMPSFRWVKLEAAFQNLVNREMRSHTCHAEGAQLVLVGGYPPGTKPPSNADPDPDYIKILNMNDEPLEWSKTFNPNSVYKSSQRIRTATDNRRYPFSDLGWAHEDLEKAFACAAKSTATTPAPTPTNSPTNASSKKKLSTGSIAGIAVGGLAGICLFIGFFLFMCRHPRYRRFWRKSFRRTSPRQDPATFIGDEPATHYESHATATGKTAHAIDVVPPESDPDTLPQPPAAQPQAFGLRRPPSEASFTLHSPTETELKSTASNT